MKPRVKSLLLFGLEVLANVAVIVILVVTLRSYVLSPFQVHGPSMCDTLNQFDERCLRSNGEYILIYKFGYQNIWGWQVGLPDRGDIVVFTPPDATDDEYYIKRIIGLPGETVEVRDGYVYVINEENPEGFLLEESSYLNELNLGHTDVPLQSMSSFEVPEGYYFVMGDNRRASSDSRRCFEQTGCDGENTPYISLESIRGKAWFVFWPLTRIRVLEAVSY
jgi:signal peptidase I